MKSAARSTADARALLFDADLPEAAVASYLPRFEADCRVGLDLRHFSANAPAKAAGEDGVATWLPAAPPTLVLGAERDFVVDEEGVRETARFLGTEARLLPGLPHDVMLCTGWRVAADEVLDWIAALPRSGAR